MSFSVVIPLWNKKAAIGQTVASVLAQTWPDLELVVVDDGSTDGSADALAGFDDPRLRIVRQANAGAGPARNRGIAESRHAWIAFLDADDRWAPDHLAELDRIRRAEPDAALIGTAFAVRHQDGFDLSDEGQPRIERIRYFERSAQGWPPFCASSAAIPRRTFEQLGGFGPERTNQDVMYFARIALEGAVAFSSRVTAVYLRDDTGLGAGGPERGVAELRSAKDVSPVVRMLLERYPAIADPGLRRDIDRFIDFRIGLCARQAASSGDLPALRALPRLCLRPPRLQERLIFAAARLPGPVARALYRLGFGAKAIVRRLRRRSSPGPDWLDAQAPATGGHAG